MKSSSIISFLFVAPLLLCSRQVKGQEATTAATTTTTTTTTLPLWEQTGCPPSWQVGPLGSTYSGGDVVSVNSIVYQCKADVFPSCSVWEPGGSDPWDLVWTILGSCEGQLDPPTTTLPPPWEQSGCPSPWQVGPLGTYKGGAVVSSNSIVYECKANVYASCSAWEPGGVEPWDLVWTILGSCEGQLDPTNEPTVGPTTASPTWNLGGCPPFWVGGDEYNGGGVC